mmetsp:Transcript_30094/g.70247  ORF Transcript_30094/g.70247 Transcript_30094/m.70247 type:complete len:814 (+) Transcript_30094:335-2776(+)
MTRARSLSRVFNSVPSNRPHATQATIDMVEYYCHLACVQMLPERVRQEEANLTQALQLLEQQQRQTFLTATPTTTPQSSSEHPVIRRFGRLWSRLQIASISIDLGSLHIDKDVTTMDRKNTDEDNYQAHLVESKRWNEIKDQLEVVQRDLLRRDANFNVPPYGRSAAGDVPEENDQVDTSLQNHSMFQADLKEVLFLMDVHAICSQFRERVSGGLILAPSSINTQTLLKRAMDDYEKALQSLFSDDEEIAASFRATTTQPGVTADPQIVPRELTGFLLKDLFQEGHVHNNNDDYDDLEDHPAIRVPRQMLKDSLALAVQGTTRTYCFANVIQKARDLLVKWSESILSVPTLVHIGYGGVSAPMEEDEDADVSSFGSGNHDELDELDDSLGQPRRKMSEDTTGRANKKRLRLGQEPDDAPLPKPKMMRRLSLDAAAADEVLRRQRMGTLTHQVHTSPTSESRFRNRRSLPAESSSTQKNTDGVEDGRPKQRVQLRRNPGKAPRSRPNKAPANSSSASKPVTSRSNKPSPKVDWKAGYSDSESDDGDAPAKIRRIQKRRHSLPASASKSSKKKASRAKFNAAAYGKSDPPASTQSAEEKSTRSKSLFSDDSDESDDERMSWLARKPKLPVKKLGQRTPPRPSVESVASTPDSSVRQARKQSSARSPAASSNASSSNKAPQRGYVRITIASPPRSKPRQLDDDDDDDYVEEVENQNPLDDLDGDWEPAELQPKEKAPRKQGRHRWTEEEVDALIEGLLAHGERQWREISCDPRLQRRSNVDIKDKHRQLLKSGNLNKRRDGSIHYTVNGHSKVVEP